jgi:hypothetical protein
VVAGDEADYAELLKTCTSYKKSETATFDRITETYTGSALFGLVRYKTHPVGGEGYANIKRLDYLRELYSEWEPQLERARMLGARFKRPPEELAAVAPDRARFQRFQDEGRIQTATGKAPK